MEDLREGEGSVGVELIGEWGLTSFYSHMNEIVSITIMLLVHIKHRITL